MGPRQAKPEAAAALAPQRPRGVPTTEKKIDIIAGKDTALQRSLNCCLTRLGDGREPH